MRYIKFKMEVDGEMVDLPGITKITDEGRSIGIPADEANRDWLEYLAWLALGNEPEVAD